MRSHLPTHRITVYPMVTIRISDRHRLIQPYIHNYSWLLFTALTLYTSELSSQDETEGDAVEGSSVRQASALQRRCSQLITDCLLKGQTGKGNTVPVTVVRLGSALRNQIHLITAVRLRFDVERRCRH